VSGAIEAVTDPDAIRDKLSPVIPDAGMLYKLTPSPLKLPVYDPVNGVVKVLNCKDELIKVGLLVILLNSTVDAVMLVKPAPLPAKLPENTEADIAPCTMIVLVTRKLPVMYMSSPVLQ
jgi:hypothetical protein